MQLELWKWSVLYYNSGVYGEVSRTLLKHNLIIYEVEVWGCIAEQLSQSPSQLCVGLWILGGHEKVEGQSGWGPSRGQRSRFGWAGKIHAKATWVIKYLKICPNCGHPQSQTWIQACVLESKLFPLALSKSQGHFLGKTFSWKWGRPETEALQGKHNGTSSQEDVILLHLLFYGGWQTALGAITPPVEMRQVIKCVFRCSNLPKLRGHMQN